jgi:hypothetical protein
MSKAKAQITIATLDCTLSDLLAYTATSARAETVFAQTDPLSIQVKVEFVGSGAIALLPLTPIVQVEFFAKGIGAPQIHLGHVLLETVANQFCYEPTLMLSEGLQSAGLLSEKVYQLSALLRVGHPSYPAFVTGFIEGLLIQTYNQQ